MVKQLLVMIAALAVAGASIYYRREEARNATDYTDPLRYERMSWVGVSVDYRKEPLVAWKIISGPKSLDRRGGGRGQRGREGPFFFGAGLEGRQRAEMGEGSVYCRGRRGKRRGRGTSPRRERSGSMTTISSSCITSCTTTWHSWSCAARRVGSSTTLIRRETWISG